MMTHDDMANEWGTAAAHAEHRIHDTISYSLHGQMHTGTILWICEPGDVRGVSQPTYYVVQPDSCVGGPELIRPANIVIEQEELQLVEQTKPASTTTDLGALSARIVSVPDGAGLNLLEMLATLSPPISIKPQTDDNGRPFYVWYIGNATPERPYGLYVGINRDFAGALKQAIERLIKYHAR